jgi:hypothetical protein
MYINLARHFALFIFLFIGSFVLNAIQADAQVSTGAPRLEQLTKDVKPSSGISSSWAQNLQRIACADVSGEILNVTFSLEGGSGSAQAGVFAAGDPNIIHAFNYSPIYVTDVLPVIGGKRDYSFTFTSPVDLSVICPNPSTFFI